MNNGFTKKMTSNDVFGDCLVVFCYKNNYNKG